MFGLHEIDLEDWKCFRMEPKMVIDNPLVGNF